MLDIEIVQRGSAIAEIPDAALVGESAAIRGIRSTVEFVAPLDIPILITGGKRTGKSVAARLIHNRSPRAGYPFVRVDCEFIPSYLAEYELFGSTDGTIMGTPGRKKGCFELAEGGSVFFDEITSLPNEAQVQLLRTIEKSLIRPLGGKNEILVDFRPIASTSMDIDDALRSGALNEELYHRLNMFEITMPTLQERVEDIPYLIRHLVAQAATLRG